MTASAQCFRNNQVILPNRALVLANATNGQAGRNILAAVIDGDADEVDAMLARDPRLASTHVTFDPARADTRPPGQYGGLLTLAVARCDLALLSRLLARGVSPDQPVPGEPLSLALLADTPAMAELLLSSGASPDPQTIGGEDVFDTVTGYGLTGAVMMLLRHGLDLRYENAFGYGHLNTAVDMEQFTIAALLIEKGANPFAIGGSGEMAAQKIASAPVIASGVNEDARKTLFARLAREAATRGLPWPPPAPKDVRARMLAGEWPTPAMVAGKMTASPTALARMRERFGAASAPAR